MARLPGDFLPLKTDVLMILLAVDGAPSHGYAIIRDVARRTEGAVRLQTGALYRALKHLLDDGLIHECDAPADADVDDERRRYYRTTKLGAAAIEAELDRMAALVRSARAGRSTRSPGKPRLA